MNNKKNPVNRIEENLSKILSQNYVQLLSKVYSNGVLNGLSIYFYCHRYRVTIIDFRKVGQKGLINEDKVG